MKLISFNIQNYRSVIHSGWCNLAPDNITALIGQNESGKTSVLEALYCFYTGIIHEDMLRSDLSLPIISCRFELEKGKVLDLLNHDKLPSELLKILKEKKEFILTRTWKADRSSSLFVSSDEIINFYEKEEVEKASIDENTRSEINKLLENVSQIFLELQNAEIQKNEFHEKLIIAKKELDDASRAFTRAKSTEEKIVAEKAMEAARSYLQTTEDGFRESLMRYEELKKQSQEKSEKVAICRSYNEACLHLNEYNSRINEIEAQIRELEHLYEIATKRPRRNNLLRKLRKLQNEHAHLNQKLQQTIYDEEVLKLSARKIFSGISLIQAENEAREELMLEKNFLTIFDIGLILFGHIPVFEFFEDFSSLLPNKIDLEDILDENTQVEGFKAARNFLLVAGLNAEFFREKNHRILKQKIENLNGEITINFQDYWSQKVGRNNKIMLSFELEHYDYTQPEKSGKPYLEFWIKDKQERLYPKQRSRGVRWFLSFYLELKATAKTENLSRILLIDEPGLSLHARAQEDVLKVFEDIRDSMQIIYCTHSPHLIDVNKLYRIIAVQRVDEKDDRSETIILNSNDLYSASHDTLSPIYSHMGVRIHNQDFIREKSNVIVEDTLAYYYFNAFWRLSSQNINVSFIPATGLTNIPALANIMLGWKVQFSILLMGESRSDKIISELNNSFFFAKDDVVQNRILKLSDFEFPEDIFSTLDFKKFVLHQREGITSKNSDYIIENRLSRTILASQFLNYCENKGIKLDDFDESSRNNINLIINKIVKSITI